MKIANYLGWPVYSDGAEIYFCRTKRDATEAAAEWAARFPDREVCVGRRRRAFDPAPWSTQSA